MNIPMKKIVYVSPPKYDSPEKYREYIAKSCNYSCVYCSLMESESIGATFNIDHFKPKALFPTLYSECENLRYSCPRCNSYKRAKWISIEQGCERNCDSCKKQICKEDIPRFIDCLIEDPKDFFYMSDSYEVLAKNSSKVAEYTIDTLRLNRVQLKKMRHVREDIDRIISDIESAKKNLEMRKKKILSAKVVFNDIKEKKSGEQDLIMIIGILFEMMLTCIETEEIYFNEFCEKLNNLRLR